MKKERVKKIKMKKWILRTLESSRERVRKLRKRVHWKCCYETMKVQKAAERE